MASDAMRRGLHLSLIRTLAMLIDEIDRLWVEVCSPGHGRGGRCADFSAEMCMTGDGLGTGQCRDGLLAQSLPTPNRSSPNKWGGSSTAFSKPPVPGSRSGLIL